MKRVQTLVEGAIGESENSVSMKQTILKSSFVRATIRELETPEPMFLALCTPLPFVCVTLRVGVTVFHCTSSTSSLWNKDRYGKIYTLPQSSENFDPGAHPGLKKPSNPFEILIRGSLKTPHFLFRKKIYKNIYQELSRNILSLSFDPERYFIDPSRRYWSSGLRYFQQIIWSCVFLIN